MEGNRVAKTKKKPKFVCEDCGKEHLKPQGFCDAGCGIGKVKERTEPESISGPVSVMELRPLTPATDDTEVPVKRYKTHSEEFNRVLGGGLADRSLILVSGDPGKGKSTLVLQTGAHFAVNYGPVIYATGEEGEGQVRLRRKRLGLPASDRLYIVNETRIQYIEAYVKQYRPLLLIVDSVQTMVDDEESSKIGSVSQIKAVTSWMMQLKKEYNVTIIAIAHVTKEGDLAGPRMLEHMVDTYLHLEGEKYRDLRMLYANKNRNGNTSELGMFQMKSIGMIDLQNAASYFLSDRLEGVSGSAVVCISHKRPILVEVQALLVSIQYENANAQRIAQGFERNRLQVLLGVLEQRANRKQLSQKNVIVNVAGGIKIDQPGADLAMAMAIYSSETNMPIDEGDQHSVILGEIGLSGEVRPVADVENMINEIEKTGYNRLVLPERNFNSLKESGFNSKTLDLIPVRTVKDAIAVLFKK